MSNMNKLDFRLVPTKGVTTGGGFRAEFLRGYDKPLDMETVIREAQAKGAFFGLSPSRVRCDLEAFFDTMIENVLTDGKTRKLDGYLELSLKIHGNFEQKTDDFDETKHSLDLGLKALSAFRRKSKKIQPVNVNRVKQFRVHYITAADGLHKNHEIVYGQEFIIRGSNLTFPNDRLSGVFCQVRMPSGIYYSAQAPIVSKTDSEIRCAWPSDYGPDTQRCRLWANVSKVVSLETPVPDTDRTIAATIYPPAG